MEEPFVLYGEVAHKTTKEMKKVLKALWQFFSYVFVPRRRPKDYYNL